jgi:hypothetical protein
MNRPSDLNALARNGSGQPSTNAGLLAAISNRHFSQPAMTQESTCALSDPQSVAMSHFNSAMAYPALSPLRMSGRVLFGTPNLLGLRSVNAREFYNSLLGNALGLPTKVGADNSRVDNRTNAQKASDRLRHICSVINGQTTLRCARGHD